MKRSRTGVVLAVMFAALVASAASLEAHDLFLRLDRYFVPANSSVRVYVLNGTFTQSENAVERARIQDLSLVTPSGVTKLDTTSWRAKGDTSMLTILTGTEGTYVVGASVRPSEIRLEAKDFNAYLLSDGVPDILAARRKNNELDKPARERYSKHVKAVLQVGERRRGRFDTPLGYPAELIPLANPYTLRAGSTLGLRALVDGEPVAHQLVIAGGRTASGQRIPQQISRTNGAGVTRIRIRSRGVWYVKFIHMAPAAGDTTIDYESKWATVTFAVR